MAAADTARLIATLELNDKFSKGIDRATTKVDKIDRKLGAFSGAVNRNVGRAVDAVVARGVRFLSGSIRTGLEDLATLEDATRSADAAIAQTGNTGKVTSAEIAAWANDIEANIGAAFDDKDIVAASSTLLRFGKVTSGNLKPALTVIADLAVKTGSVDSAATLLAKALADPTKAAGKLARQGIILTDTQQDQIKAFVEAGKVGEAQAVILGAIEKRTKGAAEASQGPYRKALSLVADAGEDARKALAEGFLPVIERVSGKVSKLAADPKVISSLRDFGKGIAGAFDDAVDFLESVDWNAVGSGLKSAADWGKRLFDVFAGMPTEAKGVLLALVGLNKLSGGGVIKVGVDLFKEGAGGLFGRFFDRGASPGNALWVKSVGGGLGGAGGAAGGGLGKAGTALAGLSIVADIAAVVATQQAVSSQNSAIASDIHTSLSEGIKTKTPPELLTALNGVNQGINDIQSNPLNVLVSGSALDELRGMRAELQSALGNSGTGANFATHGGDKWQADSLGKAIEPTKDAVIQSQGVLDASILAGRNATLEAKREVAAKVSAGSIIGANATRVGSSQVSASTGFAASRIVGAIHSLPAPQTFVDVDVNVSATTIRTTETTRTRTSESSSRTNDERHFG